ncbi:Glutaredoxin and related proteins [hydrothermal vent metagenome]|uniref:Glutaredoxin and related proteins n=1 Tax=hydrothermal vent metagenome TaxID=652676 RepID=A0A1W1CEV1_9ZZZZ
MEKQKEKSIISLARLFSAWYIRVKNYFRQKEIKFGIVDTTKDKIVAKDCKARGHRATLAIFVNSPLWICRFDQHKIDRAFGI